MTSNLQGERSALHTLSYQLSNVSFDIVNIDWIVISPIKGQPFPIRSQIEYDRRNKRLTEWIITRSKTDKTKATEISYHFENVTEDAIHPVARSKGTVKDLLKYGAVLKEKTTR